MQIISGALIALIDKITVIVDANRHSIGAGEIRPCATNIGKNGIVLDKQCFLLPFLEEERQGNDVFCCVLRRYPRIVSGRKAGVPQKSRSIFRIKGLRIVEIAGIPGVQIGSDALRGQAIGFKGLQMTRKLIGFPLGGCPRIGVVMNAHVELMLLGKCHLGFQGVTLREIGRINGIGHAILQRAAHKIQRTVAIDVVKHRNGVISKLGAVIFLVVPLVQRDIAVKGEAAGSIAQQDSQVALKAADHHVLQAVAVIIYQTGR